jgi:aminobenzoyl-glutamate utilization protein B
MKTLILPAIVSLVVWPAVLNAQQSAVAKANAQSDGYLQQEYDTYKKLALQIWDYAELGYKEVQSSQLLKKQLAENGFAVESGVAEIPTAFVASYGSGKPVIGILAEYDALPGLAQEAVPEKKPIAGKKAGHGCGHHLFGAASVAAGISLKKLMDANLIKGTIRVYGCPAEEGGSGKVYLVRAGLFNDVDAVIHWHPGSENSVTMTSALANKSAKFRFRGISSHASSAPDKGRSALDGVEAMNHMVNMMREHVPQQTRIHYVITDGGKAPNVVPDYAEVYYYVRHPKRSEVASVFERVVKAAQAAAMGTETTMDYEIIGGTHDLLLNRTLAEVMQKNFEQTGGFEYTTEQKIFAKKIQATFGFEAPDVSTTASVKPLKLQMDAGGGSTDVGDVSYAVPTVGLRTATWAPGTPGHSWQATACGGTELGTRGMALAAKVMAKTGVDLFTNAELLIKAKEEHRETVGKYQYQALLGSRKPALDYRD